MNSFTVTVCCIEILANSVDPDQLLCSGASELDLLYMYMFPKQISSLIQTVTSMM